MTKWTGRRTAGPEHHVQVDPRVAPSGDGLVSKPPDGSCASTVLRDRRGAGAQVPAGRRGQHGRR